MRLDVDFSLLFNAVQKMGAEDREFEIDLDIKEIESIDIKLLEGLEIQLVDINSENGLLSYEGRQILLFIPEQYDIGKVLGGANGTRFHVADCMTLDDMKSKGRFNRYIVTNDLTGDFSVYGKDRQTRQNMEGLARLNVCKNCLKYLNYQGYSHGGNGYQVFKSFKIAEFFDTYSSYFEKTPSGVAEKANQGYTSDWAEVSKNVKKQANYQCTKCRVNVSPHKRLMHAHHKNGVKADNSLLNLTPLCADCHRKEPNHSHMFVHHSDSVLINQLRKEQGLLNSYNWSNVYELADPALHGVLKIFEVANTSVPNVGVEVKNQKGAVVAKVDIAWDRKKVGIAISNDDLADAGNEGWVVWSMQDCLLRSSEFIGKISR
jgi:hypothetical protein